MAKNLLERLSIRCADCNEVVSYESYDAHQLKHHYCSYCSKNLPSWLDIRTHYYLTCPKYVVNCDNCEFIFDRADYIQHDCLTHYDIRRLEMVLFMLTCLGQAATIGILKGLDLKECAVFGGIRNFIVVLVPNILFGFWGVCMWVNFQSVQPTSKDLSQIHSEQRYLYLGVLASCGLFIFINNIAMKYNSDVWCGRDENY